MVLSRGKVKKVEKGQKEKKDEKNEAAQNVQLFAFELVQAE